MDNTKPLKKKKYTEIMGEFMALHHDPKIGELNAELAVDEMGAPLIILQDWTQEGKSKDLVRLHILDAIRLKAVIDGLIYNFHREYAESDSLLKEKYDELNKRYEQQLKEQGKR